VRSPLPDSLSEGDEQGAEEGDEANSDDEDALQLALGVSASLSIADSEPGHKSGPVAGKKGKKNRRMEKEEMQEREKKASVLRERVVAQQQHVFVAAETIATSTAQSSTSVTPATSGAVQSCNTCGGAFHDVKDYRNHFRWVI
jgi:hypothetical protein